MFGLSFVLNLVVILFVRTPLTSSIQCDTSANAGIKEGNLGESSLFSWLGVLRVHLHDGDTTKIALTGVILIKENYVLANADDISRIPMHIFIQESRVMFIPTEQKPWYCPAVSYTTHPEYEYATYNTISIVELGLDDIENFPMRPICWPGKNFNTAGHLYAAGYTDDNKLLEKVFYKLQFVDKPMCEEFYDKAGLASSKRIPLHYQCAYAPVEKENCVWDNGMAFVSNVSGWFALIGLGVRGPGCASPARFIDVFEYTQWLEQLTSLKEMDDYVDMRRKTESETVQYIPTHEVFRSGPRKTSKSQQIFEKYPFETGKMSYFTLEKIDDYAFNITAFNNSLDILTDGCKKPKVLVYRDDIRIHTDPGATGHASYKLTLYDFSVVSCTCIKVTVRSVSRSVAKYYFREIIDFDEDRSVETPEDILKHYAVPHRKPKTKSKTPTLWEPGQAFRPAFLKSDLTQMNIPNAVLLLQFEFDSDALVKFETFGILNPMTTTTTKKPPEKKNFCGKKKSRKQFSKWGMSDRRVNKELVTVDTELNTTGRELGKIACLGNMNVCDNVTFLFFCVQFLVLSVFIII